MYSLHFYLRLSYGILHSLRLPTATLLRLASLTGIPPGCGAPTGARLQGTNSNDFSISAPTRAATFGSRSPLLCSLLAAPHSSKVLHALLLARPSTATTTTSEKASPVEAASSFTDLHTKTCTQLLVRFPFLLFPLLHRLLRTSSPCSTNKDKHTTRR